ncbi:uncharacterized protein LOC132311907 [Cornus florida]|uniref:uncharacterized protein LOC132311907 n=1 Tax=Cornus florida TaxID=4283 RepID=UPI002897C33C|nr:uncharacterized protein LOC132311907 [Cornus florida]
MNGFSTVDGFVELNECLAEMIKYVANEPSVGLFYVQQHTQNAVPNLVNLKNNIVEKSREMNLHAQDLEDSITMASSMKECGFPVADEMIKDIKKSLAIMSTKQPKSGSPRSGFRMGRTSSWGPSTWGRNAAYSRQDGEKSGSYLSTVLKSAKQKASNFKWPQLDSIEPGETKGSSLSYSSLPATGTTLTLPVSQADELPPSSQIADELQEKELPVDVNSSSHQLVSLSENFDDFKANKEAKLEEWLEGAGKQDGRTGGTGDA